MVLAREPPGPKAPAENRWAALGDTGGDEGDGVANEILSYLEMCRREGVSLQRGMNFGLGRDHSVILMSLRRNAPYEDMLQDEGTVVVYEGHDEPRGPTVPDPKRVDQPEETASGSLTQNGLFHRAAQQAKRGVRPPERVRVYEKLRQGIWSYNGVFHLVDSWRQEANGRSVFKFKLVAVEGDEVLRSSLSRGVQSMISRGIR
ncbi:MAG: hypothetical protein JXB04_09595 [Kiritimatiellae bacterium]|nr:hypothetical protein [Kiritimatiellia bacterium]